MTDEHVPEGKTPMDREQERALRWSGGPGAGGSDADMLGGTPPPRSGAFDLDLDAPRRSREAEEAESITQDSRELDLDARREEKARAPKRVKLLGKWYTVHRPLWREMKKLHGAELDPTNPKYLEAALRMIFRGDDQAIVDELEDDEIGLLLDTFLPEFRGNSPSPDPTKIKTDSSGR